ncbi:MAG: S41 family peptidase [Blastocatellia bacterium]|nr:S41 family peptidase [Blastocatellia bacterium]
MKPFTRHLTLLLLACGFLLGTGSLFAQEPPPRPDAPIDAKQRTEAIDAICAALNKSYVFPEVAKEMEKSLRKRQEQKEYDTLTTGQPFADALTKHLQEVSHDKHIRVRFSVKPIPTESDNHGPTPAEIEDFRRELARTNFGFEKVERLPGNIGYLDLRGFLPADLAGETAAAAMTFLSNSNAVIIDLRRNGGGSPGMVALLCSYLFDAQERVHLNDLYWREGDRTEQFWTLPYVPGKRLAGKDVYVLTSSRTFSAAEEFTYNLKNLKRATIVGETTGGGANPGGGVRLSEHFQMFVPTGRAINPISKTNWEGTGVKPDIEVPSDLALKTAHLEALKKVIEQNKDEELNEPLQRALTTVQKELDDLKQKK